MTNQEIKTLMKKEGDKRTVSHKTMVGICLRTDFSGNVNGYVGVPSGYRAFNKHYDSDILAGIAVHGGLTYSDTANPNTRKEDGLWWLGFDTAHLNDLMPNLAIGRDGTYRSMDYVESEIVSLINQLLELENNSGTINTEKL